MFRAPADPYTAELIHSVPVVGGATARALVRADGGAPLLALQGVAKSYGGGLLRKPLPPALHPLDLALPTAPARIVAVVGQSGSGKTTLGALALGFIAPSAGRVLYRGQDVASLRGAARHAFRREVQAVFQDPYSAFNPFYRVDHGLLTPLRSFGLARSGAEARPLMEVACRQVGLDPDLLLGRFAHELSGGQRQRLMVARAMMLAPRLLVADEPVSMVDASLRASILDLLVDLRDRLGISILYITHDLATAYRVADEVLVLHRGRVVERGDPAEVFTRPSHPYTSLLLDCLPWPDPERPWGEPGAELKLRTALAESDLASD
ncbi:MAG: ATP-binding cassette domain-containing protein [Alphaproteobacteria bacterium]|nr:ATP-binding cassette domain-containing protein [Alphaproteobacteria bacterium]